VNIAVLSMDSSELLSLVRERASEIRAFLEWAEQKERVGSSMYLANRQDISDAREAIGLFSEAWWGLVVFSCFGSLNSTRLLCKVTPTPIAPVITEDLLRDVDFTRPRVGHHRKQATLVGAKRALVTASRNSDVFYEVLHRYGGFDVRYRLLRAAHLTQWGRTTCYDLLIRSGALGVGGFKYQPEIAYLAGSTGPRKGYRLVWGEEITDLTAPRCEGILQAWHQNWPEVATQVGACWSGAPYAPGDLENALCIYQESAGISSRATA
jgi:hypothetical protein